MANLENFTSSVSLFDSRVDLVAEDSWQAASPCEGWSARDVVSHVINNLDGLRLSLSGKDFFEAVGKEVEGDIAQAWKAELSGLGELMEQCEQNETVSVGGNEIPTPMMVDSLMRDIVIHTWDLSQAIGADDTLPDDLVAAAITAMGMVTEEMRVPGLYGKIVEVDAGADAQTQLLSLSGRSLT